MSNELTEKLDTLYSSTWQNMRTKAVDNIFKATPLWYWLYSKGRIRREPGGRWLGIQLMYAKNTTIESIGPGGKITIANVDPVTTAKFDWKVVAGSVLRLHADDTENTDKFSMMNMVDVKLKNLELSMIDTLEAQVWGDGQGNNGKDFDGLQNLVSVTPTVGSVGGFDRSNAAYSWWRNFQRTTDDTGKETADPSLTFNMRRTYNSISIGNDHPTLILAHQDEYERYESSLVGLLQVRDASLGDAGFEALKYKGAAMTYAPSAPDGELRMLNERYIECVINSHADFTMTDWKPIPDQLDRVAQVVVKGNLVINNARMHGVLSGL